MQAGYPLWRALKAGTSVAAELLGRSDLGVLAPGKLADIRPRRHATSHVIANPTWRVAGGKRLGRRLIHFVDDGLMERSRA